MLTFSPSLRFCAAQQPGLHGFTKALSLGPSSPALLANQALWSREERIWRCRTLKPRVLQDVTCRLSQALHFDKDFKPADNPIDPEYWLTHIPDPDSPESFPVEQLQPEQVPTRSFWSRTPVGSVRVRNRFATHTRLTPVETASGRATADTTASVGQPVGRWIVEMDRNYSREWPSVSWVNGQMVYRPGFLEPLDDPRLPIYWFYSGLERFVPSPGERFAQVLMGALYLAMHFAAFNWLTVAVGATAALAAGLEWATGRLSMGRAVVILALGLSGKAWIYWWVQGFRAVDSVFERWLPPIYRFMWANFLMWIAYIALTPVYFFPLPVLPAIV